MENSGQRKLDIIKKRGNTDFIKELIIKVCLHFTYFLPLVLSNVAENITENMSCKVFLLSLFIVLSVCVSISCTKH